MKVDVATIFYLDQAGKRGAFSAQCVAAATADARLDLLESLFRGESAPSGPIRFQWAEGSRLYDLLLSTLPSYLISDRVLDAFRAVGATGWSSYPIELRGKARELIEGYSGLVVKGRCDRPQNERSRVETRIGSSGKPYKVKIGLYFDEASWDGSDVFTAEGSTFVFVTEKVKRALEKAKITGLEFTPLSEFERMW